MFENYGKKDGQMVLDGTRKPKQGIFYRGAFIGRDSDRDCWVHCILAVIHGERIYEGDWISWEDDLDQQIIEAIKAIDEYLASFEEPFAIEKDFLDISYGSYDDWDEEYKCESLCSYRPEKIRLGVFYIDEQTIPAAAIAEPGDGETFIYYQIPMTEYQEMSEQYDQRTSLEEKRQLDEKVMSLAVDHYLIGGTGENAKDRIVRADVYNLD